MVRFEQTFINSMKKIYFLTIAALVSFSACNKDIKSFANVDEDIPYHEEVDVPIGSSIAIPLPIVLDSSQYYAFATNFQSYLSQYNTSSEKVISVKLKELTLKITNPANGNLNFIDSIAVYVVNNGQEKLAGYKAIPNGVQSVDLNVTHEDYKQEFLQDSVHVKLRGFLSEIPVNGTKIDVSTVFHLLANPLN
jgi:hypothetical protein